MNKPAALLDRQLSRVMWEPGDRAAVLGAIRKEKPVMKRKLVPLLAAVLLLALLSGAAVAATMLWGVEDFADRLGEPLPTVSVQQTIPQSGGVGSEMIVTATSAVWDGQTVRITLHCQPRAEDLLLMEACLSPDMTANNLDPQLTRTCTIAEWAAASGYTDVLGVCIDPVINDRYVPYRVAWHLEDGGSYTLYYEFDGVAEGPLDVRFACVTWGWDEARGSFCSDERNEVFDLYCTLTPPAAP